MSNPYLHLIALLGVGQENARTGRDLATELQRAGHIPRDQRDPARIVRQMVHDLRAHGVPICADSSDGFYLAANPDELDSYVKRLGGRIYEILKPYNRIKRTARLWNAYCAGQTSSEPEREPLPHIPEPYRGALLAKLGIRPAGTNAAQSVTTSSDPRTTPTTTTKPTRTTTPVAQTIQQLIVQVAAQMPLTRDWTLERAVAHVTAETCKLLRQPPYRIPIPLNYMVAAGYSKDAVANLIRPIYERKMAALHSQPALITEEESP